MHWCAMPVHKNLFALESRNLLAINDKFEDDIQNLIETGKEKGYLTYGDVNDMMPEEIGISPTISTI